MKFGHLKPTVLASVSALGLLMSSASAATFVYVGSSDSQDVTVLSMKPNGDLTPVETMAIKNGTKPGGSLPMSMSPNKKRIYVGLRNEPFTAATYDINGRTGKLTLVGTGPLAESMAYINVDKSGKFLLSASYGGNKVTVNPINAKGVVEPQIQIMETKPNAHCIIFDPTGKYVLHTSLGGDVIYQDKWDAKTGKLTPNTPATVSVKDKAGPRHITFSPNKKFVYLLNELDASIYVFPWDAKTGTMKKEVQVASSLPKDFKDKPWAADIHLTPNGKFLYASERTSSTIAAFSVDAKTGMLTPIDSYATEKQPRAFSIDRAGQFLLSVGELSNSLTVHAIDPKSGKLTKVKDYAMGKKPNWVEIVSE